MQFADNRHDFAAAVRQDGARLLLPNRTFSKPRQMGAAVIVGGAVFVSFLIGWMAIPITTGARFILDGEMIGWFAVAFGLLGMTGLRTALRVLFAGIAIYRNRLHCSLEVRDGQLASTEHFGWLTWSRRCDVKDISVLQIGRARKYMEPGQAEPSNERWLGTHTHAIAALDNGEKRLLAVAPGYPPELLESVAAELARLIENERVLVGANTPIAVELDTDTAYGVTDSGEAGRVVGSVWQEYGPLIPPGTDISIERRDDGITISIPPAGFKKGTKGLLAIAVVWNVFCGLFFCMIVLQVVGAMGKANANPTWVLFLIAAPFELVGVALLLISLNMARRSAAIATAQDRLLIISKSIFGRKKAEWQAADVDKIRVWPSGMSVNDQPIMELQVLSGGTKFGCLSQRSTAEIAWVACELNQALSLGERETVASSRTGL